MVKDDFQEHSLWYASCFVLLRAAANIYPALQDLFNHYDSPVEICSMSSEQLKQQGIRTKTIKAIHFPDKKRIEQDLSWLESPHHHLLTIWDSHYPKLLKNIYDPPIAWHISGQYEVLNTLQISIVGSRRPSPEGRRVAHQFALQLAQCGVTITSGLAYGIDISAHKGALQGDGQTVAVLGSGLENIYPAVHSKYCKSIKRNGAIVSEFPLDFRPTARNFPLRNRIISGLGTGTLVVEAAPRSGSLITARLALEQGREVFAVPGCILNPNTKGCHQLIRDGATLVDKIEDIFEEIGPALHLLKSASQTSSIRDEKIKVLDEKQKLLLDNIGSQPINLDSLVDLSQLTVSEVATSLLGLELNGLIESLANGGYVRC